MRKIFSLVLLTWSCSTALAQQPPAPAPRETAIIEALQQQRNQANDAVAVCVAESRKEIAELKAKIAQLEKSGETPASPAPAKK